MVVLVIAKYKINVLRKRVGNVNSVVNDVVNDVNRVNEFSAVDELDESSWDDIQTPERMKKAKTGGYCSDVCYFFVSLDWIILLLTLDTGFFDLVFVVDIAIVVEDSTTWISGGCGGVGDFRSRYSLLGSDLYCSPEHIYICFSCDLEVVCIDLDIIYTYVLITAPMPTDEGKNRN
ncbi:hypothetical protein Tco_0474539 [Tanacetum coccineum]